MREHRVGIIMNGVTGRMGTNQHLLRSIAAIIEQGGLQLGANEVIVPDPILVGRNEDKLKALCKRAGVKKWSTDLDAVLADDAYEIYFDSQTTGRRADGVRNAVKAGKSIYCEKPSAVNSKTALELYQLCQDAGIKNGVVQDKLWLPGMLKVKRLFENGFFGDLLSVRGEFGYWVFEGHTIPAQRPSWNYRKEDDGGIIVDMLCHWRYVLDHLFGKVKSVSCLGATHIPERIDEQGKPYKCTADDSAYATFELENGVIAHFNSSWNVRVRRDDLLTLQIDGSKGSAVAGLRDVKIQHYGNTPKPIWNPDIAQPIDFFEGWAEVPEQEVYDNAFKVQWEMFLRHVVKDEPFPFTLLEGAKGVQLAELGIQSWEERRWVDVPDLD
ncbi:Gfo/Idh/MocA family oxidoreductase [bacterium]|jgi:predicted dehydrogenase|nr:Gfo/Idh/MocA family oxidoreductase [bacterium]MDC0503696.1 Gfo/Idh/MocA family oxidoreductase [Verrucomicrobiales bacterium]MDC3254976.1 Gfo/Idh/MocA family oxidoreductase [bacterium]MDF1785173.1 Gfo/Idh/MocA family oxidoreductase [Verrucomicrobiales bacterium]